MVMIVISLSNSTNIQGTQASGEGECLPHTKLAKKVTSRFAGQVGSSIIGHWPRLTTSSHINRPASLDFDYLPTLNN
ncbi:hypothetical protein LWI29_022987 [Acer saccharum]|uniref:Uncharacterized protein n=1 Tax=Acer saccharum TaxID=4024 RepID=A0AA39S8R6_ACESA|nr:hypothetical protein LWI29_022987 [Acer saccharum]